MCPFCICVIFVFDYLLSSVVAFLLLANWLFIRHVNKNNCSEFNYCIQLFLWDNYIDLHKGPKFYTC